MLPVAVSPPGKTTWRASLCAETGRYLYFSERTLFEINLLFGSARLSNSKPLAL
jgi:hypothetical protein